MYTKECLGILCVVNLLIVVLMTEMEGDFGQYSEVVRFSSCQRMYCDDITIVDDVVLELVESFNVSLERNGLHSRITLEPTVAQINITDDDGEVIMLYNCRCTV